VDIPLARRRPEVTLHRGSPPANQPIRHDLRSARAVYCLGEQRRLIVPALEEPGPVQGYWDQQIGSGEDLAAGTVHPPSESGSRVGMVAMLESEQEAAAVLVVAQHCASLMPGRRLTRTAAANCVLAHGMGKGQTAKHAPGRREESNATPAPTAQRIWLIDDLAAGKAARWQHAVDERPTDPSQPIGSPRGKGCRCLHHDTSSACGRIRQLPSLFFRYCPRGPRFRDAAHTHLDQETPAY
jgi:hypothetical protein